MSRESKSEFWAHYQDPRWQKMRLEIMQRDDFTCRDCRDKEKTLNVHHAYYVKGRRPWEYPAFSLETLCRDCHEERHANAERERENGENALHEWEIELNWLLRGNQKNAPEFWNAAAEVAAFVREHDSPEQGYEAVRDLSACAIAKKVIGGK